MATDITLQSIAARPGPRRILDEIGSILYNGESSREAERRKLQVNGIQLYYLVVVKNRTVTPSVLALQNTLSKAVNKGVFLRMLKAYGGADFANAAVLYPSFVDISPTNAPTAAPSKSPTVAPSQPTAPPSPLSQYRTNVPTYKPTSAVPSYAPTQPVFVVLATQGVAGKYILS